MKNLLSLSPSKILIVCGLGLMTVLGSFWHHQMNQSQIDKLNVLNQGVGTCFNRVSQTFTAMMIKDIRSPYLHQDFMALSDECLNETIKSANPFRQNVDKGYETLNRLHSETAWFHEKVTKVSVPMVAGQEQNPTLAPISERFTKIENIRTDLIDVIDETAGKLKKLQMNDELLMGAGLIVFVLSLSLLSLQEFNRLQLQKDIEKEALNYLKAGQANVGAIVDQLVEKALYSQNMPVTAQIFKDYHGEFLERSASTVYTDETPKKTKPVIEVAQESQEVIDSPYKTSLKEVLVSLQSLHSKDLLQISDVRDVQLAVDLESMEQMLNAAVTKLASHRLDTKRIMISNQIHSDRTIVNLFLANANFTIAELEFSSQENAKVDGVDMNLQILKEIVSSANATWNLENKVDRNGKMTGMNIRIVMNRVSKDKRAKNLISVVKGKKKDLTREMMN